MPEFDLIGRIRDIVSVPSGPECVLGIGDDAADIVGSKYGR